MKFPGLSRVFSVLMAVMSIVLCFTGIYGINSTITDKENDEYRLDLLRQRTSTYEEYLQKLDGEESYASALERYEQDKEEYDEKNAQHRTDLAIYTATEGGIKEGKQTAQSAKHQLDEAAAQIDAKQAELADPMSDLYKQMAQAALDAVNQNPQVQQLRSGIDTINSLIGQIYEGISSCNSAISLIETSISQIDTQISMLDTQSEDYASQLAALQEQRQALESQKAEPAQTLATLQGQLSALETQKAQLESTLSGIEAMALQSAQQMAMAQIDAGKATVNDSYNSVYGALNTINNMEDDLAVDKETLEQEKAELDVMLVSINEQYDKVQQLKHDENKLTSTKILLESNTNIKAAVDSGVELIIAAKAETDRFSSEYIKSFDLKMLANILLIMGGVFGLIEVPCAFEKINKNWLRKSLPIAVVLLCAVAQCISMYLGRGNLYSAISAGIVALISSIFIIPDKKKVV